MGNYEPLNPQVIGMQWPAIRQESVSFDLGTELGYTFTVTGSSGDVNTPVEAQFALSHLPTTRVLGQVPFISIYPRGQEDNVGRIERISIPVASGQVTGATLVNTGSVVTAVRDPSDDRYIQLDPGDSTLSFELDGLLTELQDILQGRRILKVNLLYSASGAFSELDNSTTGVYAALRSSVAVWSFGLGSIDGPIDQRNNVTIGRVNMGDVNPFWSGDDPYAQAAKYPWRFEEIDRMTSTGPAPRVTVAIYGQSLPVLSEPIRIHYVALEVVVCEENRVRYGGESKGSDTGFDDWNSSTFFENIDLLTTSFQVTGALDPGDYSITLTLADAGDIYNSGDKARFGAVRQAEELPPPGVTGVQVTKWQDPAGLQEVTQAGVPTQYYFAGDPPTVASSNILPGIGILSAIPGLDVNVTAPHGYYLLKPGPVLDDTIVRQGIVNAAPSPEVYFPWVRFYARRLGNISRTLRIRALSGIPSFATIDQDTFDALPEIVDGWREVTLRLDSATPSFSNDGSVTQWEWDTVNGSVAARDQWEIAIAEVRLIATAAVTYGYGVAGSFAHFNNTYDPPGVERDYTAADAVLMFSQDPIAVSGLALEVASQEVTGIGLECATLPECVPTGIAYHHVTWSAGEIVCDTFSRAVTGGWGDADTGQTYTNTGGSASDYEVGDGTGALIFTSGTGSRRSTLSTTNLTDPDMHMTFSINQEATAGASLTAGFTARGSDPLNQYVLSARCNDDNSITALIERVVAGSFVALASVTVPDVQFFPGQTYHLRARLDGTLLQLRVWEQGLPEPTVWHASATDSTYTSGAVGVRTNVAAAYAGEFPVVFTIDDFTASEITVVGNHYELQRRDDVDNTWHTIMVSSDLCPTSFRDYEARVGVESRYRIRLVNALRFPGPWSDEVASTLPAPGVFGAGDGNGVLIFTANERQNGSVNLAYTMSWERAVEEGFAFPEAGEVQLQSMYQRDYVVAFHGTERGGERFSRTLLVNNAAVPSGLLRDGFRSLRDMAWADLSYVCVRNELGDRWLANVRVPDGTIARNRRLYLATVEIAEVTDTPSQVTVPEFPTE